MAVHGTGPLSGLLLEQHQIQRMRDEVPVNARVPPIDDECIICMAARIEKGFLHGADLHFCVCGACASKVAMGMPCPLCRAPVERVINVYSVVPPKPVAAAVTHPPRTLTAGTVGTTPAPAPALTSLSTPAPTSSSLSAAAAPTPTLQHLFRHSCPTSSPPNLMPSQAFSPISIPIPQPVSSHPRSLGLNPPPAGDIPLPQPLPSADLPLKLSCNTPSPQQSLHQLADMLPPDLDVPFSQPSHQLSGNSLPDLVGHSSQGPHLPAGTLPIDLDNPIPVPIPTPLPVPSPSLAPSTPDIPVPQPVPLDSLSRVTPRKPLTDPAVIRQAVQQQRLLKQQQQQQQEHECKLRLEQELKLKQQQELERKQQQQQKQLEELGRKQRQQQLEELQRKQQEALRHQQQRELQREQQHKEWLQHQELLRQQRQIAADLEEENARIAAQQEQKRAQEREEKKERRRLQRQQEQERLELEREQQRQKQEQQRQQQWWEQHEQQQQQQKALKEHSQQQQQQQWQPRRAVQTQQQKQQEVGAGDQAVSPSPNPQSSLWGLFVTLLLLPLQGLVQQMAQFVDMVVGTRQPMCAVPQSNGSDLNYHHHHHHHHHHHQQQQFHKRGLQTHPPRSGAKVKGQQQPQQKSSGQKRRRSILSTCHSWLKCAKAHVSADVKSCYLGLGVAYFALFALLLVLGVVFQAAQPRKSTSVAIGDTFLGAFTRGFCLNWHDLWGVISTSKAVFAGARTTFRYFLSFVIGTSWAQYVSGLVFSKRAIFFLATLGLYKALCTPLAPHQRWFALLHASMMEIVFFILLTLSLTSLYWFIGLCLLALALLLLVMLKRGSQKY